MKRFLTGLAACLAVVTAATAALAQGPTERVRQLNLYSWPQAALPHSYQAPQLIAQQSRQPGLDRQAKPPHRTAPTHPLPLPRRHAGPPTPPKPATGVRGPGPASFPSGGSGGAATRAAAPPASGRMSSHVAGTESDEWNMHSSTWRITLSGFRIKPSADPDLSCMPSSGSDSIAASRSCSDNWLPYADRCADQGSSADSASCARRPGS